MVIMTTCPHISSIVLNFAGSTLKNICHASCVNKNSPPGWTSLPLLSFLLLHLTLFGLACRSCRYPGYTLELRKINMAKTHAFARKMNHVWLVWKGRWPLDGQLTIIKSAIQESRALGDPQPYTLCSVCVCVCVCMCAPIFPRKTQFLWTAWVFFSTPWKSPPGSSWKQTSKLGHHDIRSNSLQLSDRHPHQEKPIQVEILKHNLVKILLHVLLHVLKHPNTAVASWNPWNFCCAAVLVLHYKLQIPTNTWDFNWHCETIRSFEEKKPPFFTLHQVSSNAIGPVGLRIPSVNPGGFRASVMRFELWRSPFQMFQMASTGA